MEASFTTGDAEQSGLKDELRHWTLNYGLTHCAVDNLLGILRNHGHEFLPKTTRTLLQTPSTAVKTRKVSNMDYYYIGITKQVEKLIESTSEDLINQLLHKLPYT